MKNFFNSITFRFSCNRKFLTATIVCLFTICLLVGASVNRAQAQAETYAISVTDANGSTYSGGGGSAGMYNAATNTIGMYANGTTCPTLNYATYYQTFTTNGVGSGTARVLQVGDSVSFQGNLASAADLCSTGFVGISLNDNTTYSAAAYGTSQAVEFLIGYNGTVDHTYWYATPSAGSLTTLTTTGNTGSQGSGNLNIFAVKVTSATTINIYMSSNSGSPSEETFDQVVSNLPIKSFSLFASGIEGGGGYNAYFGPWAIVNTGKVDLGYGNNASPITVGAISDGTATQSSTSSTNNVVKEGTGTIILGATNTYSGTTTIYAGTLTVGATNAIPTTATAAGDGNVVLDGGTLSTAPSATPAGFNDGTSSNPMGTLTLSATSTIALGTGNSIYFSNSGATTWSGTLNITGWMGTYSTGPATAGHIFVGTTNGSSVLTAAQLADITFSGFGSGATQLSTGELVPASPPAPTLSTAAANSLIGSQSTNTGYSGQVIKLTGQNFGASPTINFSNSNLSATGIAVTGSGGQNITFTLTTSGNPSGAAGTISVTSSSQTSGTLAFTFLGFITSASTDWNTPSTWLNGAVPPSSAVTTVNSAAAVDESISTPPASITINSSESLTFATTGAITATTVTNNGTITMGGSGTFTITTLNNNGAVAMGGTGGLTATTVANNNGGTITTASGSTFTGTTTTLSTGSTLTLGAANTVASTSAIVFAGGTLATGTSTGYSNTFASITMTVSSALTFVSAGNATPNQDITFTSFVSFTGSTTLTVSNWQGSEGTAGTYGRLFIGNTSSTLTSGQAAQVSFSGLTTGTQITGGEVVPSIVIPVQGAYDSYVYIGGTAASNLYYLGTSVPVSAIPDCPTGTPPTTNGLSKTTFNGANLGTFPLGTTTETFNGGAMYGWINSTNSGNLCGGDIYYQIYSTSGSPGSFTTYGTIGGGSGTSTGGIISPPISGTTTCSSIAYYFQEWGNSGTSINLLNPTGSAALPAGTYYLEVYMMATGGSSCATNAVLINGLPQNSAGSYYKAQFTIACAGPTINTQPVAAATCNNGSASFNVTANQSGSGANLTFVWYLGTTANAISNGSPYSINTVTGPTSSTSTLTINPATTSLNGNNYLVQITSTSCANPTTSNTVGLTVPSGVVWTGTTSADWNVATNWCGGAVPLSTDNVTIPSTTNKPVIGVEGANAVCNSITIASGATLTIENGYTLTISSGGSFTNNSSTTALINGTGNGSVVFAGTGSIAGSFATSFYNLTLANGAVSLSAAITVTNALTLGTGSNSATLTLNGNNATIDGLSTGSGGTYGITNANATGALLTFNNSSPISFAGSITNGSGGGALSLTMSGSSTLTLSGGTNNAYSGTTTISAGTLILGAANSIPSTSAVTLSGGTLESGTATGYGDNMGSLSMTASSSITLVSTTASPNQQLKFSGAAATWTGTLTINDWNGTSGSSGSDGQVFTSTLSSTQLGQIQFVGDYAAGAVQITGGEVSPTNVVNNAGVYDSYVVVAGTTYFLGSSVPSSNYPGSSCNLTANSGNHTAFNGATIGSYTVGGSAENFTGATINVWKDLNGATNSGNVCSATIYYRVYSTSGGSPSPGGSFTAMGSNLGYSSASTCGSSGTNTQVWTTSANSINLLNPTGSSALAAGNYAIQVYISVQGDPTANNCNNGAMLVNGLPANAPGSYYTASFTILCAGPTINTQPVAASVCNGGSTSFSVIANEAGSGSGLTFQWFLGTTADAISNGSPYSTSSVINGSTSSTGTLTINPATSGLSGNNYLVQVTSTSCAIPTTSNTATLTVPTGVIWTGTTSTDWNVATNWCGGAVPMSTDNVTIPSTTNKPVIGVEGANAVCNSITLASGATLTIENGYTLTISAGGSFTNNSSAAALINGTGNGTVIFAGTGSSIAGSFATSFYNLTLTTGTVTLSAAITVTNNFTMGTGSNNATLTLNGNNATIDGLTTTSGTYNIQNANATGALLTFNNSSPISFAGAITNGTGGGSLSLTMSGSSTLTLSDASNAYSGTTTISAGTLILGAANVIPITSAVTLSGGTLSTGTSTGYGDNMGILSMTASSAITFVSTTASPNQQLKFSGAAGTWTGTLTVNNWQGSIGTSGLDGQLFVGTTTSYLTNAQLGQASFTGFSTGTQITGGEVAPTFANVGIYDSYITVGSTNYYLGVSSTIPTGFTTNPGSYTEFQGANLGELQVGGTYDITYGQESVWKNNILGLGDVCGGDFYYSIYPAAGSPSFSPDYQVCFSSQGSQTGNYLPQIWTSGASGCSNPSINILSGLTTQGTYKVQVYLSGIGTATNTGCNAGAFEANGLYNTTGTAGANYTATFTLGPGITGYTGSGYTGYNITINGSGFTGATAVTIGGVAATIVSNNGSAIVATVGQAAGGNTITVTGSTGVTSTYTGFTYLGYISEAVTGNWSTAANWYGGEVPTNGYPVTIGNAATITLDGAANALPSSFTVASGNTFIASDASPETLTISATASATTLTVATGGTWNNGTGGSTVFFTAPATSTNVTIAHTISGTISFNNVSVGRAAGVSTQYVQINFGTAGTVLNNYSINNGGSTVTNPPIYGTNSTLIYNTGNVYTITSGTVEWVGTATSGAGVPRNVQIGTSAVNNSGLSFGAVSVDYQVQGNLTVGQPTGSGYSLTLSSNSGFTLEIGGNYTIQSGASVTNLDRGIEFNGSTAIQQIQYTGGGMVYFDYLILDNPNWNLQLYPGTNVTINYSAQPTATVLQFLNNMQLDLNGNVFTMNGAGAEITVNYVGRTITSSVAGGIFAIYGSTTVVASGSGTLNIGVSGANSSNTTLQLNSAFDCGVGPLTYIYGTLQMQNNGYINNNSPEYETGSLLDYNSGNTFGRRLEWNAASGPGYPYNVTVNTGTTLDPSDYGVYVAQVFSMAGNLHIYGNLFEDVTNYDMQVNLTVGGDIIIETGGKFSASNWASPGADISLGGNWTNNGTFTPHLKLVSLAGNGAETLGGTTSTTFAFLTIANTSGGVTLGNSITVDNTLYFTSGNVTLGSNNITMGSGGSLGGTPSSTNMVITNGIGQFIWTVGTTANTTYIFPVGDATPHYTPASLTFATNSVAGTLGVNVVNMAAPNIGSSPSYLNRYWNFGNSTLTGNYSYTGSFDYIEPGDVTGNESKIQLGAYSGSVWQAYYGSSASTGTLTLSETLNQTTAPLTGVFTGREGTPTAYAVTGGNNCYSTTVGVANSQDAVSYQLFANGIASGNPIVPSSSGSAISFGAQTIATATTYTVVATDGNGNTTQMTGSASVYPTPVPTAGNNGPVCPYLTVTLSSGPNGLSAYNWSGPNSYTSSSQNPQFTSGGNEGIYTVVVTNSNGCTASNTTTVSSLPLPVVTVSPTDAVCTGSTSVTLTSSASSGGGGPYSYSWAPSTFLNTSTGNTVTASISVLTFYTVTGTGANGCSANSAQVPVATVPAGGTVLPVSTVICSGGTQVLTASGVAGHDYQWQESVNNIYWTNISGATNTTYTTASADGATKKYYRILANSNACWDIASTTAIVDISITPTVSFTAVTSTSATVTWTPFGSGQYSISWMGAAGTGSASALTTNTYTITGLSPNASLLVTVTPTVTCGGSVSPGTAGTNTLCAVPGSVTVTAAAAPAKAFKVTWAAVNGATAYVVYYRNLLTSSYWSTVDTSSTQKTVVVPYAGATYAVYVAAYGCPASGDIGDGSAVSYVTTNPLPEACISIPDVTATSGCPNQITVGITGGSGSYELTLRRLSPSLTAGVTYAISGSTVNITVGTQFAGTVWEVFARNVCSAGNNSAISGISIVTVKPGCPTINNLVLSHVSCSGFIASWNTDNCAGEGITAYQLLIKQSNELNYDGYSFSNLTDYAGVDWLNQSRTYNVEIRSIACNGATSALSAADTITTTSCNTREEQAGEDVTLKSTGNTEEAVAVYPNPSDGQFFDDIGRTDMGSANVKIELVNELGQVVQTNISTISGGHLNQLVSTPVSLSSGIYFVRTTVGSNVYINKLMITKE